MLQTKEPDNQFNQCSLTFKNQPNSKKFHFKRSDSRIIQQNPQPSIDLDIQDGQQFICYECGNGPDSWICQACQGAGFIKSTNPLVVLMNQIFNSKFSPEINENKKQMISTKSSSNSNISDSLSYSEILNNSLLKNSKSEKKKPPENQKCSRLQFLLTPLQTIIKQESTVQDKCQKCNICHYEFDGVKYNCPQCENYNVCEQCYSSKHIEHCHGLKKMQSVSSQKTGKQEEKQLQQARNQRQSNVHDDQIENTHSDVDKLSFKSDESVQLMFKGLETKRDPSLNKSKKNRNSFFQLHQIQQDEEPKSSIKRCQNCNNNIEDCYWICQSCQSQGSKFQICKSCYDSEAYIHPKNHNLGLNFFTFDQSFLQSENYFFDCMKEQSTNDPRGSSIYQICNERPISSLSLESNSTEKQNSNILSIGVIGHRDIFTGFHKQPVNDHYPEEIISPIPRSIALTHSFKEKKGSPESDCDFIAELIKSPHPANIFGKTSLQPQKINVKSFNDQSRVEFDDNIMTDLALSSQYNEESSKALFSSQRKERANKNEASREMGSMMNSVSEINPETSILQVNQGDFEFVDYYCDICGSNPIKNVKYHCLQCESYDLCSECYENKRLEHWHDHYRKDDGKQKVKKIRQNKEKVIKKAIQNLNRSISPTRKSIRFMK